MSLLLERKSWLVNAAGYFYILHHNFLKRVKKLATVLSLYQLIGQLTKKLFDILKYPDILCAILSVYLFIYLISGANVGSR